MSSSLNICLDTCTWLAGGYHSIQPATNHRKLGADVSALGELKARAKAKGVKVWIGGNARYELITSNRIHSDPERYEQADRFWADCPIEILMQEVGFRGARGSSGDERYEAGLKPWNQILPTIADRLRDQGFDTAHWLNARYFRILFLTVDYRFLNKLRNEGRSIQGDLGAMRPTEFIKSLVIRVA